MITILWILLKVPYHFYISLVAAAFTLISGLDYFLRGVKALNAKINPSSR
jgi:phosphatidylglycerophosphate synthase